MLLKISEIFLWKRSVKGLNLVLLSKRKIKYFWPLKVRSNLKFCVTVLDCMKILLANQRKGVDTPPTRSFSKIIFEYI